MGTCCSQTQKEDMSYHTHMADDPGPNNTIGVVMYCIFIFCSCGTIAIEKKNQMVQTVDSYCYSTLTQHAEDTIPSNHSFNIRSIVSQDSISKPVINHDHVPVEVDVNSLDEIGKVVYRMTRFLYDLQSTYHTNNESQHRMDAERFQRLIVWVNFKESHLDILKSAWTHDAFWPFLTTEEAKDQVGTDINMVIRLSNSTPGAISVTRSAKTNNGGTIVRHRRYLHSSEFGKLSLPNSKRRVTWDGLVNHLYQKECAICLEELKGQEVLRLNCGHHFHKNCIEQHIQYTMARNGSGCAKCPLCRQPIEMAESIDEPKLAMYQLIDESKVSSPRRGVPMTMGNKVNPGARPSFTLDQLRSANGGESRWGIHLSAPDSPRVNVEDEYGNVAQVRNAASQRTTTSNGMH